MHIMMAKEPEDCKISIKEINNINGNAGKRYVCADSQFDMGDVPLTEYNDELLISQLQKVAVDSKNLSICFSSKKNEELLKTLNRWAEFLNGQEGDSIGWDDFTEILWKFSIVGSDSNFTTVKASKADSPDVNFQLRVLMGFKAKNEGDCAKAYRSKP